MTKFAYMHRHVKVPKKYDTDVSDYEWALAKALAVTENQPTLITMQPGRKVTDAEVYSQTARAKAIMSALSVFNYGIYHDDDIDGG